MQNLQVHNPHFITYADTLFTIDVLGGVDLQQIEKMICTLRITHKNYPPMRSTLDLYSDSQTDKLIRTLCDCIPNAYPNLPFAEQQEKQAELKAIFALFLGHSSLDTTQIYTHLI